MMLYEKYRPRTWSEVVGQDAAVRTVRALIEAPDFDGDVFWIDAAAGASGVGKTTIARLIGEQLADPFFVTLLPGDRCNQAAVREIERSAWTRSWSADKPFKVWIIDEAAKLTEGAVDAFLTFLENMPPNIVIIFTTIGAIDAGLFGDDSGAFGSRCKRIKLTNQGLAKAQAKRVKEIAQLEGKDGQPPERYERLAKDCNNNMRAQLQKVQAGAMLAE